jgi:predicted transposase YdaD
VEGREKGRKEGRVEEREEARERAYQEKLESARKLKGKGVPVDAIAESPNLSPKVVEGL